MSIDIANEAGIDVDEVGLVAVARFTLDQMRIHPLAELSVLLVDERTMTELHERWMGEPGPTDVLAFPMDELRPPHLGGNRDDPGPEPGLLGDVVLCPQVAAEQAEKAGHSTQDELELLCVHGILHLLGYDHAEPEEHADMFGTQDQLLKAWQERTGREGATRLMTAPAWLLVAAALLALVAGWCANAEAALALVSATGAAERAAGDSPEAASRLAAVAADLPRYMSVLLLVRALCEIFAAVLVTAAFVSWLGDDWRAVLSALAVMIGLRYLLTGVRPQTGRVGPRTERTAQRAAAFLFPLTRALGPLPRLLVACGNALPPTRRVRPPADQDGPVDRAELRGLVDYLERRNGIEPGERDMVRSVFELGDTIVREVMVPRTDMVFIEADKTVEQALSLALRSGFSRIPVVGENEDDVVGIAYLKDIVAWSHEHPGAEATEKVATVIRPASYVPDSKPVDELLRQMQAQRSHVAIVIDEYGGTAGLVTIEDILEEIVGEITDEYDNEQPPVEWLSDGSARVTARLSATELGELFGVNLEDEDVETVAGLLAHALGRVPIAGSAATVRGLRLTAENLAGRRNKIGTVLVERENEDAP